MRAFILRITPHELTDFFEIAKPAPYENAKLPPDVSEEDFDARLRQTLSLVLAHSERGNSPERIDRIMRNPEYRQKQIARYYGDQGNKKAVKAFLSERAGRALPLEKTFHALHWLITGHVWGGEPPLANAVCGGTEYGPDIGYGKVRYLEPSEVLDVASALAVLDTQTLLDRWDAKAMRKDRIYAVADKDGQRECALRYPQLQQYFTAAAEGQDAVLSYIL